MSGLLLALCLAAVTADPAKHTVTFTATATGVAAETPLEFVFAGPETDRDYETLFITESTPEEIAAAFAKAGIPNGRPTAASQCRFWPVGEAVTIMPDPFVWITDKRPLERQGVVYTGGKRTAAGRVVAADEMPRAIFALYTFGQSLLQFDDAQDQSVAYGRFLAAQGLKKGESISFTVSWNGQASWRPFELKPETDKLAAALQALRAAAEKGPVDVLAHFPGELKIAEARALASALAALDSRRVKVNGAGTDEFFFRAFLPLEKWRDRTERLSQPIEIRVGATNAVWTVVDEDWSVEGIDPKLTPRTVTPEEAVRVKADTCFFYAAPEVRLSSLYLLKAKLPKTIRNFYVYAESL